MADQTVEQGLEALQKLEESLKTKQEELAKVQSSTAEEQTKKAALEQELSRVQKQIDEARENKRKEESTFAGQFRDENQQKAKQRIVQEFSITDAKAVEGLDEMFKRLDTKGITEDKIYDDYLSAYVVLNRSKLVETDKTFKRQQEEAERFTAAASGSAATGNQPTPMESVTLDDADKWAIQRSGINPEKYKELKAKGLIF